MLTSEVLNKAADLIEERGWWQSGGTGPGTCADNAIIHTAGFEHPATEALWTYLGGKDVTFTYEWNDAPERTEAEVIETLRACALIEQARESQDAAELTYAENMAAVS